MRPLLLMFACLVLAAPGVAEPTPLTAREVIASVEGKALRLTLAPFRADTFTLRVIDNAAPNDTGKYARLAKAMEATGAFAGCNGGFFNRHPFDPVGLMIASGVHAGTFDPQSWMRGLIVVRDGQLGLEEAITFRDGPDVTEALQSGPWLVRDGKAETPHDARVARRTFVCTDGVGTWALGAIDACTLDELATVLASEDVAAILPVRTALNFDGGPSTGLWVRGDTGHYSLPERWTVRNYLAVVPRETTSNAQP